MTSLILACTVMIPQVIKLDPSSAKFEGQGVHILVTIEGNDYIYRVTNLDTSPVMRFEIGQFDTYKHEAPSGWQIGESEHLFSAWTTNPAYAINTGQWKPFQMRVTSAGAVLATGIAKVTFANGHVSNVEGVWRPGKPSATNKVLLSAVLAAIVLAHAIWVGRRRHRIHSGLT